jgi:nucleoid-associated protein YgaU
VAATAKPPIESSAARLETPASTAQITTSQPTIPPQAPVTTAPPLDSQVQIPDSRSQVAESQTQLSGTKGPDARPRAIRELASAGWVSVPNSGKILFEDATNTDAARDDSNSGVGPESTATHDVRAHAAKDVSFELESPQARGTTELDQNGRRPVVGSTGAPPEPRSGSAVGRVEPNAHVVEPLENFWTISRLYYSSGRYYRALWKANSAKYPEIDKLKINDVIMIPAVEDLDPAYIDQPRSRAPSSLGTARSSGSRSRGTTRDNADAVAESSVAPSAATRGEPISTARTNRGSGDAIPVRRSSRTDPDLDLPTPDVVSRRDNAPDRAGRLVDRPLGDDDASDEPETRTAARPRATAAASKRRPVYKIRPYDTLRSIARDMLGDSHRSSEILDLNRDLIDDPAHLIVGQVLELPDDARSSVRRSASR